MVDPNFQIVTSRAFLRVSVVMRGFWQRETFEAFAQDIALAVGSLNDVGGQHTMLCDATGCGVAAGDVISALFDGLAGGQLCPVRARKIAIVAGSPLSRLQVDRLRAARDGLDVFDNRSDADAWLRIPGRPLHPASKVLPN